ncbi:hypothetical protein CMV_024304 [Castanea mollissima]|uniref:Uncharacterized protein n=1 Tax=Castanea mollissima TaxID=60419 RepID=A0A8J4QAW4_9ROSI|nr:hypothetical protein CMV_024304 [Castanea mollissima]
MTTKLAESLSYQYMGDFNRTPIPTFLGSMASLTHLGLSYSNFSGRIPHQLGNLSNLCYLNLAGKIPLGTQLQTFDALSYIGNPQLCGYPLPRNCTIGEEPQNRTSIGKTEEDSNNSNFYIGLGLCDYCAKRELVAGKAKKLPPLVSESRHYLAKREWYRFMLFKMNRWQRYCTRSYFLVLS